VDIFYDSWLQRNNLNPPTGTVSSINTISSFSSFSETQDSSSEPDSPVISKIVTNLGDLSMEDSKSTINSAKDSAYETEIDVYGNYNN